MTALAMVAEFDDVAGWTADAVELLGERHAVPAACRGSASPAALAWLAEACELAPGMRLLDVGAGVGGPAAWAAERFGVRPILIEPMPAAGRAAARLFGPQVLQVPDGNHFPTCRELDALLEGAGFEVLEQLDQPGRAPLSWSRRADQVAALVARRHRADPAYALAARQGERFARLFATGQIAVRLIHAVSRPAVQPMEETCAPRTVRTSSCTSSTSRSRRS
ncbi:hypothetical protein AB0K16_40380 [Nonomuraea jabiensis]|uniref:SAM-dependent methyltransferase n=1 Tax=Nonomuraea jabiensis TaxID=882448 RepID=UPI00341F2D1D